MSIPFFWIRMQRREGRRASEDWDYRSGLLLPRYPVPVVISGPEIAG